MGAGEWFKAQAFGNPDAVLGAARLDFDQAGADAAHHGLGASAGVQLAENRVHVELRGVVGNVKARGDLLVAESFGQHFEYLQFARRERSEERRVGKEGTAGRL